MSGIHESVRQQRTDQFVRSTSDFSVYNFLQ